MGSEAALLLFSGGQDSATCLAWALQRFERVDTVGFSYGQRHHVELEARKRVRGAMADGFPQWAPRLGQDRLLDLGLLGELGGNSLTDAAAIGERPDGLPDTFVPGRNLLFLTAAAALASQRGCRHLVAGVCETDFSGYPDCRDDTVKAMQVALNLGMNERFVIHTPLMWRDKAHTWQLAHALGGDALIGLLLEDTHSCYLGERRQRHPWGYGCGNCPACELRAAGWQRWQDELA
ncbi:7-cyano-7-deazaguanine synthase QueC [Methylonatrum kenyense]|uniref:7-cyano-7-deazaguanine synthase QueC n=1 Tax=Methylonatrum kenyense TaxID=455253 RepID=UPI0020BD5F6A|nr:7-cyano-7-deazaguanine synthase QueC [Methylonatrum kenyense]MCK8516471.1 7-cyano-7-deazaguanine synthase QueC [Methylonatrum kenyense]